jgi:hypothetical protein
MVAGSNRDWLPAATGATYAKSSAYTHAGATTYA